MFEKLLAGIPTTQKRRAEKCVVRECDETEKNTFIAYVDEGSETFDVNVTLNGEEVSNSGCDCKQRTKLCQHKLALLLYIAKPPATKSAPVKTKRADPAITLLGTIEPERLRDWFGQLLLNNKDIRLAFELQFAPPATLTMEEIVERTKSAVKTVVKNKKNVDVNQLKKIIDLWIQIHDPIIKDYYNAVYSKDAFSRFQAALKTCSQEYERITTLSNKILIYIGERVNGALEPLRNLVNDEQWQQSIDLFFTGMNDATHFLKMCYLGLLKNLLEVVSESRATALLHQMMARYRSILAIHPAYQDEVGSLFIELVISKNKFEAYRNYFTVIDYAAAYNYRLVESLIAVGDYALAEKICQNEIKFHAKNNERLVYYQWLLKIYEQTGQSKKLFECNQRLFPYSLSFDQYLQVYNNLPGDKERNAWRTSALRMTEYPLRQLEKQAVVFRLRLFVHESNRQVAINMIADGCLYVAINEVKEEIIESMPREFLIALLYRRDDFAYLASNAQLRKEQEAAQELAQFALEFYGVDELNKQLANRPPGRKEVNEFTGKLMELVGVTP